MVDTITDSKRAGAYILTCLPTGECYVGGSRDVGRRFQQHKYLLRRGRHYSARLQQAWAAHGESAFSFAHAVRCSEADILKYEQFYIDRLQPEFNTEKLAGTALGTLRTEVQKEMLRKRPQSTAKRHKFGDEMRTVPEISRITGLSLATIRQRIRQGRPLDEPNMRGAPQAVDTGGEMLTPQQIAAKFDLPLTTVYSRLRRGWSGSKLTEPRKRRARNSR